MSLYVSFDCESCENENCTGKGLKPTVYKCDGYKHKQTNADRIRAMTDEDLAMLLQPGCPDRVCRDNPPHDCYNCWLDWLKQEVKNG